MGPKKIKYQGILYQLVTADERLRTSGNILAQVRRRDLQAVLQAADRYFELPVTKPWEVFELGIELGRIAKQRMVTWIKLPKYVIYFIGTEADVLRRLAEIPVIE